MFIDTHAHVYVEEFKSDLDSVLKKALDNGIQDIYMPNIDSTFIEVLHNVEKTYPFCHAMMGLHPCSVGANYEQELAIIKDWIFKRQYIAIGEIGIDLYWDTTFAKKQEIVFRQQIEWALELDCPIVIHSRESLDLTISIVSEYTTKGLRGVFHCFTGNIEQGLKIIDLNFYMGIGGVLTYKNSGLDKVVGELPMSHLVLETDSPYLAPVPHRGKRNEPSYIVDVASKLATIKNLEISEIASITTNNAKNLFSHTSR